MKLYARFDTKQEAEKYATQGTTIRRNPSGDIFRDTPRYYFFNVVWLTEEGQRLAHTGKIDLI